MMHRLVIGAMAATAIGVLFGSALWAQQPPHSASGGVFTTDQAERGSAVYFHHCFKCHLDDLTGGAAGPPVGDNELPHDLSALQQIQLDAIP